MPEKINIYPVRDHCKTGIPSEVMKALIFASTPPDTGRAYEIPGIADSSRVVELEVPYADAPNFVHRPVEATDFNLPA